METLLRGDVVADNCAKSQMPCKSEKVHLLLLPLNIANMVVDMHSCWARDLCYCVLGEGKKLRGSHKTEDYRCQRYKPMLIGTAQN